METTSQVTPGKTTIDIDVLLTIARLTTLSVPGVSRMSRVPTKRVRSIFLKKHADQGVYIDVEDDIVNVDLYVIVKSDVNIREVGRNIQTAVARAITEMIGMQVGQINIHVEDIDYPEKDQS
jgi:uncharacterized alkaline shock family protein YloU